MKALTLTQPWAMLVAIKAKTFETRSWSTDYRGPLAIHVSKRIPPEYRRLVYWAAPEPFRSALKDVLWFERPAKIFGVDGTELTAPTEKLHLGCVIATCELVQVYRTEELYRAGKFKQIGQYELAFGDYTPGRYAWKLANVKLLPEPIPAKGSLGLWNWDGGE